MTPPVLIGILTGVAAAGVLFGAYQIVQNLSYDKEANRELGKELSK